MAGVDLNEAIRSTVVEAVAEALAPLVEVLGRIDREPVPLVYTVAEAAVVLGVSVSTVNRWIDAGVLPRLQHTSTRLLPRKAVERFVDGDLPEPMAVAS